MLSVLITIDTEYSPGLYRRGPSSDPRANYEASIACITSEGDVGIHFQMDVLDRYGLKAVFFVDPFPGLLWGTRAITAIVEPIVNRGHDVQLHLHTEWLEFVREGPFAGMARRNIKDFTLDEQISLITMAREILVHAGAPSPVAFRAGNYGANDDTLSALASLGLAYDTSFCPGIHHSNCDITLPTMHNEPLHHRGVTEVPIGSIAGPGHARRHAQITALSTWELTAAIRHAACIGNQQFTIVSHSFELLSRDRRSINHIVKRRFERVCHRIALMPDASARTYGQSPPLVRSDGPTAVLPHNFFRTASRMAEQVVANTLYGRK